MFYPGRSQRGADKSGSVYRVQRGTERADAGDKKVKILQQILIMFKSSNSLKATWVYWDKTEIALKRYQLARWVINSFDDGL